MIEVRAPSAPPAPTAAAPLGAFQIARVFARSLLLQASWNRRGMQHLGFAYALWPALARLYPDPQARARALDRHLGFFNTHPYMAAAILGGVLRAEERIALGQASESTVAAYKGALAGPFAAIGDGFFWTALRPAAALLAIAASLWAGVWSLLILLAAYNVFHLSIRWSLFAWGHRRGDEVIDAVRRLHLPAAAGALRIASAMLAGATAAAWATRLSSWSWAQALALAAAAAGGYAALRLGARLYAVLYGGLALAAGLGWIAWR
jgi:PTS system mannose-specific IID component